MLTSFQLLLYFIICPLLLYNSIIEQPNIKLLSCSIIILLSHLYRDCQNPNWIWPSWTEPIGFIIGYILMTESNNIIIKSMGIIKMSAHIRQTIYKDNIYY